MILVLQAVLFIIRLLDCAKAGSVHFMCNAVVCRMWHLHSAHECIEISKYSVNLVNKMHPENNR